MSCAIVRSHLLAVPALLPNRYFDHMRHISGRLRGRTNVNHVITILPVVRRGLLTTLVPALSSATCLIASDWL